MNNIKDTEKQKINVISFTIRDASLCLNINYVDRIIMLPMLRYVPNMPEYFVGVLNYSGECIDVFDLPLLMGMQRHEKYDLDYKVIIINQRQKKFGIVIEKNIEQMLIDSGSIDETGYDDNKHLYEGIVLINNAPTMLLNIESIASIIYKDKEIA